MGCYFTIRLTLTVLLSLNFKAALSQGGFLDYEDPSPCGQWRPGDPDLHSFDFIRQYQLDQRSSHFEGVSRVPGSNFHQTAYHLERESNLTMRASEAFPLGVPPEFSFESTFRTEIPPQDPWYLFHLTDFSHDSQLSVTMNPPTKTLELTLPNIDGNLQTVVFRDSSLFDESWHKVMLGVTHDTVKLWVDCELVYGPDGQAYALIQPRGPFDHTGGYFSVAQHVYTKDTVPIDLQWMVLSCDATRPMRQNCEEIPQYNVAPVESSRNEGYGPTPCPEQCPQGPKGDRGDRGQFGERGAQGFPGIQGSPGVPGPPGAPGITEYRSESQASGRVIVGPPGPQGIRGEQGLQGFPGRDGQPGNPGMDGLDGQIGLQGLMGPPGPPGQPGPPGETTISSGSHGLFGLSGRDGAPGLQGPPGPPGEPGLTGHYGSDYGLTDSDVRDICLSVVRDHIAEITSTLIGPPGPPGPSRPGRPGNPGPQGPSGNDGPRGPPGERGFPGIPGLSGASGGQGIQGERGEKGDRGEAGIGREGQPGQPGAPGLNGEGRDGAPGRPGDKGDTGVSGAAGPRGPPGTPGICPICPQQMYYPYPMQQQSKGPSPLNLNYKG